MNNHKMIRIILETRPILDEKQKLFIKDYTEECEATEKAYEEEKKNHQYDNNYMNEVVKGLTKELEEIKAMVKDIGDGGVSFDTSYQRMVFEALMNRVGR